MTNQDQDGEWINGLTCTSAGLTRKNRRTTEITETEPTTTETDEEIRAEFEAAARRQPKYR